MNTVVVEVTDKGQLKGNDFCQFYRDFQGHEVGLGVGLELGTKSGCLWPSFSRALGQQFTNTNIKINYGQN